MCQTDDRSSDQMLCIYNVVLVENNYIKDLEVLNGKQLILSFHVYKVCILNASVYQHVTSNQR